MSDVVLVPVRRDLAERLMDKFGKDIADIVEELLSVYDDVEFLKRLLEAVGGGNVDEFIDMLRSADRESLVRLLRDIAPVEPKVAGARAEEDVRKIRSARERRISRY